MYDFLATRREALLAPEGPLAALRGQQGRFLFRGTQMYTQIREFSLAPDALRDGVDASIELERLAFAYLFAKDKPNAWRIIYDEISSLESLDIPHFSFDSEGTGLHLKEGTLSDYFDRSSMGQLEDRVRDMGPRDRDQQLRLIRASVLSVTEAGHRDQAPSIEREPAEIRGPTQSDISRLRSAAETIAADLRSQAVDFGDGYANWLGTTYIRNSDRFNVNLLPPNLYDGVLGVALFLAASHRLSQDERNEVLCRQALQQVRVLTLSRDDEGIRRLVARMGMGGSLGLGSMVYGMCHLGDFLGQPELIDTARQLMRGLDPVSFRADPLPLDVMDGVAGLLLGVLELHEATGDEEALDLATRCGLELLVSQLRDGPFAGGWPDAAGSVPGVGLSHGASGMAYALARLYAITGDEQLADAALRGFAYERRVHRPPGSDEAPDFGRGRQDGHAWYTMNAWCHGAAGIALARLASVPLLPCPSVGEDAWHALRAVQHSGLSELDHLCCGNFGRIEALLLGAEVFGDETLATRARQWATSIVDLARTRGSYRLRGHVDGGVALRNPALFQGLAGIGYSLLRVAAPTTVPSLAIWQ